MAEGWLEIPFDLYNKRLFVAGHRGLVGAALLRRLQSENCKILTVPREKLDLRDQAATRAWMKKSKPDVVIMGAAKVGGILANQTRPAEFFADNILIQTNLIQSAHETGVQKLLFLGSSCIYPKNAAQPIKEEALLTAPLEPSNEAYALAKIAGIKMVQSHRSQYGCDFISAMPCNLYGPGDRFDLMNSHVIPALIMKAQSKNFTVWGSGKPKREFLYVDDLADALVYMLKYYSHEDPVNIGSGEEISIKKLAEMIADVAGYKGKITFDVSKPDGVMRKMMDSSRIQNAGWKARTNLRNGLQKTYAWYKDVYQQAA